ncbi:MAG: outer membrane protein assembly factor BamE [Mariprofundaceae bacterium]|nr:outer membrane protein assembly factor BamE [Mariprofundaceae bacterium]
MRFIYGILALLCVVSCVQRPIHQGNEITKDKVWLIQKGDSQFQVETEWGSPALIDPLHANRVEYVEQVKDKEKNKAYVRGIIVEYDKRLRVKSLQRFGF